MHLFGELDSEYQEVRLHENLVWHKINDKTFLNYLIHCSGFVSTAGFESICEAMYLKKPVMMIPTAKHFEQECNALDASKAGAELWQSHLILAGYSNLFLIMILIIRNIENGYSRRENVRYYRSVCGSKTTRRKIF